MITLQPAAQVVSAGQTVTFSVTATGTAPLSYQWRKDGMNVSGATNATLAFAPANRAFAGAYSVVVSDAFGSTISSPALLRVLTTQRMEKPVKQAGGSFKLRFGDADGVALSEGDKNGFTIQWSPDLMSWSNLPNTPRSVINGKVELEDTNAVGQARRFYRVLER